MDEKTVDLEGELVKTKRHNDELRKTNKKAKVKTERLQYQIEDLQGNLVSGSQKKNEFAKRLGSACRRNK